jgi:hypothetical protein
MNGQDNARVPGSTGGDPWEDRLSEYLDGELNAFERDQVERHLAHCGSCREALDDLRALVTHAPGLKRPWPPSWDLWPAVARRLEPRTRRPWRTVLPGTARARWLVPRLTAAAVLVVACVAGIFWLRHTAPSGSPPAGPARTAPPVAAQVDAAYEDSVAELRRSARTRLIADPQVVNVLEDNLSALDRAIAEYQDALAEHPRDDELRRRLDAARRQKLEVLRHAAGTAAAGTN